MTIEICNKNKTYTLWNKTYTLWNKTYTLRNEKNIVYIISKNYRYYTVSTYFYIFRVDSI